MSNSPRILLVEDDVHACQALAEILREEGFDVSTAADGGRALDLVLAGGFGIVVTDLDMPTMSGLELLGHLRARTPAVRAIVMTAWGPEAVEHQACQLGAVAFLRKPIDADELIFRLRDGEREGAP